MAATLTKSKRWIRPEQLAWGAMLISFGIFCVIVVMIITGVQYFLFHSMIPLQSTLDVARGTATMIGSDSIEQAVHNERDISNGGIVTTDPQSQALISLIDYQLNDRLIAAITVKNGSSLNLMEDSRPRFDWSGDPYWIDLGDSYGEFDVFVPQNLARPILISMETTLGPSVRLSASGRYTIVAAGAQVQVVNYSGVALLIAPDKRNQNVPAGQTASMQSSADQFLVAPTQANLLGDSTFSTGDVLDLNTPSTAQVWRCFNNVQDPNEALGAYGVTNVDGRPALRLFRGSGALSHGDTDCLQGLGTTTGGLDVSQYSDVSIRATFKIQSQSLSTCGVDGSECPLMLAMDYIPINGGQPVKWYHGFYAFVDPNRFFPLSCSGCEQHEQINPGVWYTYESHNLKEVFGSDSVPQSILNLRFYASGHDYEVYVSEIELLAGQTEIQPDSNGS